MALSAQHECAGQVLLCKDCEPQTQPLAFPQLMEQLVLVGKKKKKEERTSVQK